MLNVIEILILKSFIFRTLLNAAWQQLLLTNSSAGKLGRAWLAAPFQSPQVS